MAERMRHDAQLLSRWGEEGMQQSEQEAEAMASLLQKLGGSE
jgi:uridine phosphorylase